VDYFFDKKTRGKKFHATAPFKGQQHEFFSRMISSKVPSCTPGSDQHKLVKYIDLNSLKYSPF
jgi:hypothetical protein